MQCNNKKKERYCFTSGISLVDHEFRSFFSVTSMLQFYLAACILFFKDGEKNPPNFFYLALPKSLHHLLKHAHVFEYANLYIEHMLRNEKEQLPMCNAVMINCNLRFR